jgi:hypothetical protein
VYWLYFFLFLAAISAPIIIEGESLYVSEDMREAGVILVAGAIAFLLYVLKEKSLLRHVREKLWFQQKNSAITKDLSQSYSYIGEVNRKVDILRSMMNRLVEIRETNADEEKMLWEVLDTIKQLTQAEMVSMRIFTNKVCTHHLEEKRDKKIFSEISDEELIKNEKSFFELKGIQGISSQKLRKKTKIFLLFSRSHNDEVDEGILNIILAFLAILDTFLTSEKKSL